MKSTFDTGMHRRQFVKAAVGSVFGLAAAKLALSQPAHPTAPVPLGLDAHALRGMGWNANQLIEYAISQGLDAVSLNNPHYFKGQDDEYLADLKRTADAAGLRIYVGAGSVCKDSVTYPRQRGAAEDAVMEGIRLARAVHSPVVNVRIGNYKDRYFKGGIEAHIDEAVRVLRKLRTPAQDAGITFGFENHAGDLRSEELLGLIEQVGTDVCGVMLDPGNSLWALEDPMQQIKTLGPHVVCTSVRDYVVWQSDEGARFQWTAIGEGMMDVPTFVQHMATLCPGVPLFVETISNSQRSIPYLTEGFWKGFPKLHAAEMAAFLKLCRRGKAIEIKGSPPGVDANRYQQGYQRAEFERSISYLRKHCGAGVNRNLLRR